MQSSPIGKVESGKWTCEPYLKSLTDAENDANATVNGSLNLTSNELKQISDPIANGYAAR